MTASQKYDYLILGNSAAAISAIESIRLCDSKSSIAVVSPEDFPAYSTPMISYLLKGKTTIDKMQIRPKSFYADNCVEQILGESASAIDADGHVVTVGDKQIGYGKLLVACGSIPSNPPLEGLSGDNVFSFMNLTDAQAVMSYVKELRIEHPDQKVRVAVIGSGLIGCKACEGLIEIADEVTMLARSPEILRSIIDENASRIAERALEDAGVDVRLSTQATAFAKEADCIRSLTLNDGSELECDIVILAAGVKANAAMLEAAGAKVERGVICDSHMQTSLEDIYAAGDIAVSHNCISGEKKVIALWPNAVEEGRVAGFSMAGGCESTGDSTGSSCDSASKIEAKHATYDGSFPINSIPLCGITICTAGIKSAGENMEEAVNLSEDGKVYTKFVTQNNNLVGFTLINRPQGAGIYTRLIRDKISLSSVDERIFETPKLIDLPNDIRWGSSINPHQNLDANCGSKSNSGCCKGGAK